MSEVIIRILPGERFTPYGLAKKLGARAMLESASFQKGRERYSLLMIEEAFRVEQHGRDIWYIADGTRKKIKSRARDILDVLLYFANQHHEPQQNFPFPAGGIGYLSYEFARMCDTISFTKRADPLGLPDAAFIFGHVFVVFDHYTDLLYVIGLNYAEHSVDLVAHVDDAERRINDLDFNYLQAEHAEYTSTAVEPDARRGEYLEAVEKVRDEIVAGNLLQGVLSRRLMIKTDMPAIEAYRRLRTTNPAPYLFYLDFGEYQFFGASPEVHVTVKGREVLIRPIAGTRRRGETEDEDKALERELLADPKECAEHLMLVDLARNDIGRVCEPGTVRVTEYMEVERYSRVMHIVSEARGTLAEGKTGIGALRATFPAGTVSGAPKIRAIEVIDRLEPYPRRFYAGCVGYLEPGGHLDTCITIRSAIKKDGHMILQAGAGIVFDSTPEREYEETGEKLAALARAVGLEV